MDKQISKTESTELIEKNPTEETNSKFDELEIVKLENRFSCKPHFGPKLQCLQDTTLEFFKNFINSIEVILFDCDGVLWLGKTKLLNANNLVVKLRTMGKRIFFITNDSTRTRIELLRKLNAFGFQVTLDEIVTSSYLTALHLKDNNFEKKAYVIGRPGLESELNEMGIRTLPIGCDEVKEESVDKLIEEIEIDNEVGAVVIGFDHFFNYKKIVKAATYLKNPDCSFLATNMDEFYPKLKLLLPDTGSIVASVATASQREPLVIGKPSSTAFHLIQKKFGLDPQRSLMIGDRLQSDIQFGVNCGLWTLLVLSGVTTLNDLNLNLIQDSYAKEEVTPNFYLNDVDELFTLIKKVFQ